MFSCFILIKKKKVKKMKKLRRRRGNDLSLSQLHQQLLPYSLIDLFETSSPGLAKFYVFSPLLLHTGKCKLKFPGRIGIFCLCYFLYRKMVAEEDAAKTCVQALSKRKLTAVRIV